MHKLILSFVTVTSLALPLTVSAESNQPAKVSISKAEKSSSDALAAKLAAYNTLSGRFTQTLAAKDGKVLQTTEGDFRFKKPGLYLWKSDEPYPQTVVGNGKSLWVYDPDLEQVTVTSQAKMPFNPATLIAGGVSELSRHYLVSYSNVGKVETFELTPTAAASEEQAAFGQLSLTFNADNLTGALLVDALGQQTRIVFSSVHTNTPMNDADFTFVPPAGTDVLVND